MLGKQSQSLHDLQMFVSSLRCNCDVQNGQEHEVDAVLRRKFEGRFRDIEIVEREDLDLVRVGHDRVHHSVSFLCEGHRLPSVSFCYALAVTQSERAHGPLRQGNQLVHAPAHTWIPLC